MQKVLIVSHGSEASDLLDALQDLGICQVLDADQSSIRKDWPELGSADAGARSAEETFRDITGAIFFLKNFRQQAGRFANLFGGRIVYDRRSYERIVSDRGLLDKVKQARQTEADLERLNSRSEELEGMLGELDPWKGIETPLSQIIGLETADVMAVVIPSQHLDQAVDGAGELDAVLNIVSVAGGRHACLAICHRSHTDQVRKLLRSLDCETVNLRARPFLIEPSEGEEPPVEPTVADLMQWYGERLGSVRSEIAGLKERSGELALDIDRLYVMQDYYANLLAREKARSGGAATDVTVVMEGWIKADDWPVVEKLISSFAASAVARIEAAEGEDPPVEIQNPRAVKPFEVITRLYGMPQRFELDPTAFLAPFFAIFFALCLTDAGYGLVIFLAMLIAAVKFRGDSKFLWLLTTCAVFTVAAGALTGGWFGDAVQQFFPALDGVRKRMMWFDPLERPMMFFRLSLFLGYAQILTGLSIAFVHNLLNRRYVAAICDQATWLVMLNAIAAYAAAKTGIIPAGAAPFVGIAALASGAVILLFSQRTGPVGGRLGMGFYNLFSTIFYVGDVLSYLRLMALGMVTAGLAMATNVIATVARDVPYGIGLALMFLVLIGGHAFNLAMSGLSAFVHTLRLQYVEFFPKFLVGGGRSFEPLSRQYKNVYVKNNDIAALEA